jgi:mRNA interferase MazF
LVARSGNKAYVPERGDVIWLQFNPQAGHEQKGRRPAVVISPRSYNRRSGLCLVIPITNQQKGYPFEVSIPADLPVTGVALSDQLESVDWHAREARFICALPEQTTHSIAQKAGLLVTAG